jgi:hypothetical protein
VSSLGPFSERQALGLIVDDEGTEFGDETDFSDSAVVY